MILQGTQARTTRKSLVPVALLRLCDATMPGLGTSRSGRKDGASLHSRFPRTCRYAFPLIRKESMLAAMVSRRGSPDCTC